MGGKVSRISLFLKECADVTLHRSDVYYVVTEYGIAYLHGESIRERAIALIAIACPAFRPWLIEEVQKRHLIYSGQAFIPVQEGEYSEELETSLKIKGGKEMFFRPVKIRDETLLKYFFTRCLRKQCSDGLFPQEET
jgi:acyl-CoA hydrolase